MPSTARCWMRPPAVLAAVMSLFTAGAGVGFEAASGPCPQIVEYSRVEQARVAEEVAALTEGLVISDWLTDYAVLRDQMRSCRSRHASR